MTDKQRIARTVLNELDSFERSFHVPEYRNPESTPEAAPAIREVYESQMHLRNEPFIAYVKVRESDNETDWHEKIYLVCRNYLPSGITPITDNAHYASRNAKVGQLASAEIGDEISFRLPGTTKTRVCIVSEKNIFTPIKTEEWDALSNNISYRLEDEFVPSARKLFPKITAKVRRDKPPQADSVDTRGNDLLKELEKAEIESKNVKTAAERYLESRTRVIVQSIALKDQPILDRTQDEICRLPISTRILLTGSPGTGKTTTLIKRIAFKSDPMHLLENDGIEIGLDRLDRWIMFTPNDLLKIYLKEAMNKEGLSATDNEVVTWDRYRTTLGRQVLKFLKHDDKGVFTRTSEKVLIDNSSAAQVKLALEVIDKFAESIHVDFESAIKNLREYRPPTGIISKDNIRISQELAHFTSNCDSLLDSISTTKFASPELKIIALIESFSNLRERWSGIRNDVGFLIKALVDNAISKNPDVIEFVSMAIEDERHKTESNAEELEAGDDLFGDVEEEVIPDVETQDLRLQSRKLLQQAVLKYTEGLASGRPLKNKRLLGIWNLVADNFTDLSLLTFIGYLNLAIKPTIFGRLDYSRILVQTARFYDRFRHNTSRDPVAAMAYLPDSTDKIKNKRISAEEVDILIFVILRFIAKIFEERRDLLSQPTNYDLLENIKSYYRTQVAVDEAADFSAIQLACIFHLAHPEFSSVSFAGDLMQRVTSHGIQSWQECDFISDSLRREELFVSYRQTPVLLQIAGKLYENSIGESAPFRTKNIDTVYDPRPLKLQTDNHEVLGAWIGNRIHEIYKLNGEKLPSIALFVPDESDIDTVYEAVHEKLNEFSIDVDKCVGGKVLGSGEFVRIFSVEYIKGLEFEAVFFVGIDRIYQTQPDLLDKYLYVGLTRATTFLGVTYKQEFPKPLNFIEADFQFGDWSKFAD